MAEDRPAGGGGSSGSSGVGGGEQAASAAGSGAEPWVTPAPIAPGAVTDQVLDVAAGAVVTFEGRVRDHDGGRSVAALAYSAHPTADEVLRAVVAEAAAMPGVRAATARHRTGELALGDLAFFVAVAAGHRREAFAACAWLVDEVKARLPVWKHQRFTDGTEEWVNCA